MTKMVKNGKNEPNWSKIAKMTKIVKNCKNDQNGKKFQNWSKGHFCNF